jgi:hypothetical protein
LIKVISGLNTLQTLPLNASKIKPMRQFLDNLYSLVLYIGNLLIDAGIVPRSFTITTLAVIFATVYSNIATGTPLKVVTMGAFNLLVTNITLCAITDNLISCTHATTISSS